MVILKRFVGTRKKTSQGTHGFHALYVIFIFIFIFFLKIQLIDLI